MQFRGFQIFYLEWPQLVHPSILGIWSAYGTSKKKVRKKNQVHCWYIEPRNREKVLHSFDNVFHVYLMNGLQKYKQKFFKVAFWDNPHYPFWDVHGQSNESVNIFGIRY